MKSASTIKRIVSVFLLCVFAIGITPKQVLHDLLTNHDHIPVEDRSGAWIGKDRYNCDDENFVAESPFVLHDLDHAIQAPSSFQVSRNTFLVSYSFLSLFFFELRGPPAFV